LPSAGFGGIDYRLLLKDLRNGLIGNHWRQLRMTRRLRKRFDLILAVGDIVPLLAATLIGSPFAFIGCAKSAYSGSRSAYSWSERWMLRGKCLALYPRDELTARHLAAQGMAVRYLGNPMMDHLEGSGDLHDLPQGQLVIAMLPGSRDDAEDNALDLVRIALDLTQQANRTYAFVMPVHASFDFGKLCSLIESELHGRIEIRQLGSSRVMIAPGPENRPTTLLIATDMFGAALRRAAAVVGMAGTANEQAIGLGVPLIVVPGRQVQGEKYVRMKMKYFGPAAVLAPCRADRIGAALERILTEPQVRAEMIRAGQVRMGAPGASASIAADLFGLLGMNACGRVGARTLDRPRGFGPKTCHDVPPGLGEEHK
jgi:uncharacterized protein (TIGR03492 family)